MGDVTSVSIEFLNSPLHGEGHNIIEDVPANCPFTMGGDVSDGNLVSGTDFKVSDRVCFSGIKRDRAEAGKDVVEINWSAGEPAGPLGVRQLGTSSA